MPTIDPKRSLFLVIDVQARLMPAILEAEAVVRNTTRLIESAEMMNVPCLVTEQNPKGLGSTVPDLPIAQARLVRKQSFGACREPGFLDLVPANGHIVIAGCEAHVCVLQTVLGLIDAARKTYVVRDAVGSRHIENKAAAIDRMAAHGAEIVTTEMVVFEWLQSAEHARFREVSRLIR